MDKGLKGLLTGDLSPFMIKSIRKQLAIQEPVIKKLIEEI